MKILNIMLTLLTVKAVMYSSSKFKINGLVSEHIRIMFNTMQDK